MELMRDNPRYRNYSDTVDYFRMTKDCPSIYGGYIQVEGFSYSRIGINGIRYYGVIPMTRCVMATVQDMNGIMYDSQYDPNTTEPDYHELCHRTIHNFYDVIVNRAINPTFDNIRTVARDCENNAFYRSIGKESLSLNYNMKYNDTYCIYDDE